MVRPLRIEYAGALYHVTLAAMNRRMSSRANGIVRGERGQAEFPVREESGRAHWRRGTK